MATKLFSIVLGLGCIAVGPSAQLHGADWLSLPSQYSHDPVTGARVSQYAPSPAPAAPAALNFHTSGFAHTRSSINYGQSADNYYRVDQWGPPVRPYGEWRFPYRPYSVPYDQWGPPFGGLNLGFFGAGPWHHGQHPGYPNEHPYRGLTNPYPPTPGLGYQDAPYVDGYHPVYRD